jgi:HK97 gp10 family phage protein
MPKKSKWGYSSYGKTALRQGISVTGLDEYLKKIEALGENIDNVVKEAIDESVKPILADMIKGAERHRDSGEVVEAIEAQPTTQEGGEIYSKVGIDVNKHPEAKHAVFQEYGDGHSGQFPDPFIRPAFDNNEKLVKKIQRDILKKAGVQTG